MTKYDRFTAKNWRESKHTRAYERLAELEDKIENGTLIELPCKVGDIIYSIPFCEPYEIFEHKVETLRFISKTKDGCYIDNSFKWFGENIFTDKAHAEKRLKELQK